MNKTASGGETSAGASKSSAAEQPVASLTKTQLTAALLTAKDLPTGYKIDSAGAGSPTDDMTGDASCQKMNAIDIALRKGTRPAQVAYADVSFSRTDSIGGGDETLSSFRTEQAAWREFSQYVVAANTCRSLSLQADATTTITLTGKLLSLPTVGDQSRAYQYVGTVQGTTFWLDAMAFRVGGTLAMVTAGGFGGNPQPKLLSQIANKAAGKLT